jgi:hypothetical protein
MMSDDPAMQIIGWVANRAVEAIVAKTIQPAATRAGKAALRHARQAASHRVARIGRRT